MEQGVSSLYPAGLPRWKYTCKDETGTRWPHRVREAQLFRMKPTSKQRLDLCNPSPNGHWGGKRNHHFEFQNGRSSNRRLTIGGFTCKPLASFSRFGGTSIRTSCPSIGRGGLSARIPRREEGRHGKLRPVEPLLFASNITTQLEPHRPSSTHSTS